MIETVATEHASLPAAALREAPAAREPFGRVTMAVIVLGFVVIGHVWSLNTGLFLDDHAHYANLREANWSFRAAVESSRLGIVGDVLDLWGRPKAGLRFFRPVAFWTMKAEYTLAGWQPVWMHAFSLAWHYVCSLLVGALAMRWFGRRLWATVAACIMAAHPAHTGTVYWIACQTELITTALLLAGILAYARAAGWGRHHSLLITHHPSLTHYSSLITSSSRPPPLKRWATPDAAFALVSVLCYALALGCRENAVLFPLVCWAGDRLCGTQARRRWLRWEHVAMLAVLAGYFAVRTHMLGGFSMPVRPYVFPAGDPGFAEFVLTKIVYYALGLFAFVPVVPMGGQVYFAARPMAFYGGFAGVMTALVLIWATYRFRSALLWPAVWIALLIAPVLPVFASSHHLYLPGAGAALLLAAGLAALGGLTGKTEAVPRRRKIVAGVVLAVWGVGLPLMTWGSGFAYRAGTRTEDILVREVLRRSGPLREGDHLFFINMPLLAYYAVPAIEEQIGVRGLTGHALTFSPDMLKMEQPGELEIVGDRQIRVRAPAGQAYFEGVSGRALLDVLGLSPIGKGELRGLVEGQPIPAGLFTVTPTRLGHGGVEEFIFTFDRPIDSPEYHFFFGSPQFMAYPLEIIRPDIALQK